MKKLIAVTAVAASVVLAACSKPTPQNTTFGQNANSQMTIAEVKNQRDDALVTFTGKILRQVDGDDYIVADSTGEIKVEIDNHVWKGVNVTPADTVRIQGKFDKELINSSVDALSIEKVQ